MNQSPVPGFLHVHALCCMSQLAQCFPSTLKAPELLNYIALMLSAERSGRRRLVRKMMGRADGKS